MLKGLAILGVVALGGILAFGRLEREMVFPFDPARVPPPAPLREEVFPSGGHELILWVADAQPGKPAILYFHGNAGNLAGRAGRFARFVERGYGLVAMGYRGSSGSGGYPGEAALRYDARRLFERMGDYAGAAPVVIYGESLGTGVTVAALAATAKRPAAVVLEAPFTSVADVALNAYPQLAPVIAQMKTRFDSLAHAAALDAPLLVIHGTEDRLIPIEQGRRLFEAAPASDKSFRAVEGAGHAGLWRRDVLPGLWRFIESRAAR